MLFRSEDHDHPPFAPPIQSSRSHDALPGGSRPLTPGGASTQLRRTTSMSLSPRARTRSRPRSMASPGGPSPTPSPRRRNAPLPVIVPQSAAEVPPGPGPRSPLGALFGRQRERVVSAVGVENSVKRVEALVEEVRRMPVNKLKDELKELQVRFLPLRDITLRAVFANGTLQDRQARIENLLLMLTRGMRNDTGHHSTIRHDSL